MPVFYAPKDFHRQKRTVWDDIAAGIAAGMTEEQEKQEKRKEEARAVRLNLITDALAAGARVPAGKVESLPEGPVRNELMKLIKATTVQRPEHRTRMPSSAWPTPPGMPTTTEPTAEQAVPVEDQIRKARADAGHPLSDDWKPTWGGTRFEQDRAIPGDERKQIQAGMIPKRMVPTQLHSYLPKGVESIPQGMVTTLTNMAQLDGERARATARLDFDKTVHKLNKQLANLQARGQEFDIFAIRQSAINDIRKTAIKHCESQMKIRGGDEWAMMLSEEDRSSIRRLHCEPYESEMMRQLNEEFKSTQTRAGTLMADATTPAPAPLDPAPPPPPDEDPDKDPDKVGGPAKGQFDLLLARIGQVPPEFLGPVGGPTRGGHKGRRHTLFRDRNKVHPGLHNLQLALKIQTELEDVVREARLRGVNMSERDKVNLLERELADAVEAKLIGEAQADWVLRGEGSKIR